MSALCQAHRHGAAALAIAIVAGVLLGCDAASAPRTPPAIRIEAIDASPENVISALVSVVSSDADSVAVRFRAAGSAGDSTTPAVIAAGANRVLVLGLLPDQQYTIRGVAFGAGGTSVTDAMTFTTGALPADLPTYTASGSGASPGYVVFAAARYGVVIDNTGRVVWYHRFLNGPWLNFQAQPNGRYVARLVTPDPLDTEPWVEIDPAGGVTRTFGCALGLQARFHDLIAEPGGGYWILCDETRTMDLTAEGGHASARVTGTQVQHVSATGDLLFRWSPFEHFLITDVDSATRSSANVNWTHGNSLDIDADGNLLVSFRNLNEITKIDSRTGDVLWRLGGLGNQFARAGGAPAFAGQHSVRAATGGLMLLDNVGDSLTSRAERWAIDPATHVATLLGSQASQPAVVTTIGGSVQALPGSRMLVSFGTEGRVEEYDAAGQVRWRIEGAPGYVFRAQRIRSLYAPGVGPR